MDGQCRVFVPRLQRYMDIELYMRNDWSLCFSCFFGLRRRFHPVTSGSWVEKGN